MACPSSTISEVPGISQPRLFINDLPKHIQSKVRLFADDCIVYREINSKADCEIIQEDFHALERWESTWAMEFHPAKCSVIRVATFRDLLMLSYKLKGHQLQAKTTSKYLGVDLSNSLDWKPHIDRIVKKVQQHARLPAT